MRAVALEPELGEREPERVLGWRLARLEEIGLSEQDAAALAAAVGVDWHEAERLVANGCPPELVLSILT